VSLIALELHFYIALALRLVDSDDDDDDDNDGASLLAWEQEIQIRCVFQPFERRR